MGILAAGRERLREDEERISQEKERKQRDIDACRARMDERRAYWTEELQDIVGVPSNNGEPITVTLQDDGYTDIIISVGSVRLARLAFNERVTSSNPQGETRDTMMLDCAYLVGTERIIDSSPKPLHYDTLARYLAQCATGLKRTTVDPSSPTRP